MGEVARDVTVRGVVQGVSYRWYCQREAQAAGVRGWVQNETDGSVRALLEGDADAVDRLVAWMRRGPQHASVTDVEVRDSSVTGAKGFSAR